MTEEKLVERVTALFADSDAAQRKMIRLYAETNDAIEASAIIDSGAEVLHMLQGGLRPEVLVLDSVLSDTTIFPLLRSIRQQQIEYEPHIIVTLMPLSLIHIWWTPARPPRAASSSRGSAPSPSPWQCCAYLALSM